MGFYAGNGNYVGRPILERSGVFDTRTAQVYVGIPGQQEALFTKPGTYTWTCPANVTSVSVLCVGGGGGGGYGDSFSGGGSGGNLRYVNNISVVPGNSYTVVVGAGGLTGTSVSQTGTNGGDSSFNGSTVVAKGGVGGGTSAGVAPTSGNVGTGGNGGSGGAAVGDAGGGGAGGYSGNGGSGGSNYGGTAATAGSGGAGGGGGSATGGTGGGGVGLYGEGSNGAAGTSRPANQSGSVQGGGGSGGNGSMTQLLYIGSVPNKNGADFGGGGGGGWGGVYGNGGNGAVRIIWGSNRAFPSTNVGPIFENSYIATNGLITLIDPAYPSSFNPGDFTRVNDVFTGSRSASSGSDLDIQRENNIAYVRSTSSQALSIRQTFPTPITNTSFNFWINPVTVRNFGDGYLLYCTIAPSGSPVSLAIGHTGGTSSSRPNLAIGVSFSYGQSTPSTTALACTVTSATWQNICVVRDNNVIYVYKNGTQTSSTDWTGSSFLNSQLMSTATNYFTIMNGYDGKLGHFSMYNRSLSAAEVTSNFNALRGRFGV